MKNANIEGLNTSYIANKLHCVLAYMETAVKRIVGGPIVIELDGEIAAGKTTLISLMCEYFTRLGYKVCYVPEPVSRWESVGALEMFYKEGRSHEERKFVAYTFQTFTFPTRIDAIDDAVATCMEHDSREIDIFILERSVLTDRYVFMEMQRELVGEALMKMYDTWWVRWDKLMWLKPNRFIYLKPNIECCMDRLVRRHRNGEVDDGDADDDGSGGVTKEYQLRLREAHEAFLEGKHRDKFPGMPGLPYDVDQKDKSLLVLNGNISESDFTCPGAPRDIIMSRIVEWLGI